MKCLSDGEKKNLDFGYQPPSSGTKENRGYQPEKSKQSVPKPPVVKPVIKNPKK